jgi:hypothetical protein
LTEDATVQEMIARYSHLGSGRKRKLVLEGEEPLVNLERNLVCLLYALYKNSVICLVSKV